MSVPKWLAVLTCDNRHENLVELFQVDLPSCPLECLMQARAGGGHAVGDENIPRRYQLRVISDGCKVDRQHGSLLSAIDNRINCKWIVRTMRYREDESEKAAKAERWTQSLVWSRSRHRPHVLWTSQCSRVHTVLPTLILPAVVVD
eukprot:757235-Hanusia_phi.AAC.2